MKQHTKRLWIACAAVCLIGGLILAPSIYPRRESETPSAPAAETPPPSLAPAPTEAADRFQTITVRELTAAIDAKETFVVFFGFENCPFCRLASPYLNEAAEKYGETIRFIDTRANPEWKSNMDIDDYDLVVQYLGDYIPLDDNGLKHLYVPHVFFIRDGQVVAEHQGSYDDHDTKNPQTEEGVRWLVEQYENGFRAMLEP